MSPENQWLEDVFPTKIVPFYGDMLVFRGVFQASIGQVSDAYLNRKDFPLPGTTSRGAIWMADVVGKWRETMGEVALLLFFGFTTCFYIL